MTACFQNLLSFDLLIATTRQQKPFTLRNCTLPIMSLLFLQLQVTVPINTLSPPDQRTKLLLSRLKTPHAVATWVEEIAVRYRQKLSNSPDPPG